MDEPWGTFYFGDCVAILRERIAEASVDLAYLDPPFNTGKNFGAYDDRFTWTGEAAARVAAWPHVTRKIFDAISIETTTSESAYIARMGSWFQAVRRVVKPSGSIWVHIDERCSHLVRLFAEYLLAPAEWQRTVIWRYRRWPTKARGYQRMHDVLLWFAGPNHTFHALYGYETLAASTLKTFGTRKQRADFSSGRRKPSTVDDETQGPPLSDVWEVGVIAPQGAERTGYPTQKPEALLERVILSTSNPGDVVLDPVCGSGTTLAVAQKHGRRWIGIDQSPAARAVLTDRLGSTGVPILWS